MTDADAPDEADGLYWALGRAIYDTMDESDDGEVVIHHSDCEEWEASRDIECPGCTPWVLFFRREK